MEFKVSDWLSRWANPLTAIALALLIAIQLASAQTDWGLLITLGVALGNAIMATLMPYVRKVIQGKAPPAFKARFGLTATVAQGAGVHFVRWCVAYGVIVPDANALVVFFISVVVGFGFAAMLNYCLAWFRSPLADAVERVAQHWLRAYLVRRGLTPEEAERAVGQLAIQMEQIVEKLWREHVQDLEVALDRAIRARVAEGEGPPGETGG